MVNSMGPGGVAERGTSAVDGVGDARVVCNDHARWFTDVTTSQSCPIAWLPHATSAER